MSCPAISETHTVIRILHYEGYYSLLFEDASILAIPYSFLQEPCLGEKVVILRSHEYGFIIKISSETQDLNLV